MFFSFYSIDCGLK